MTRSDATDRLLDRFRTELRDLTPLAVWAHGSLGGGDYQEGRSDLDLIVVLDDPITARTVWRVARLHARLRAEPLVGKLHCSYLTPGTAAGAERRHLTWAHEQLFKRTVTPVTRRELHTFGLVLEGEPPGSLLPPVTDANLAEFVVRDQRDFWRRQVDRADNWTQDVWVDLGLVTHARAAATLKDGRLITKREALDLLPGLGAPVEVVEDVRRRRYEEPGAPVEEPRVPVPVPAQEWTARRAELTRGYLGPAIDRLVAVAAYE
ncbi:nucleotidyltransferase domain-containing protein [Streptomyces sp. NBC_00878]|uniref:nucleotidyltransferase domain-containing protein n=1 Tax=Streptomyces sp. NBC_00878 TaxID=2975854 RepID=UPI002257FE5C|nr:nucleotidyltransferase domain-containing protein [Streptomyces sp. NBC_00878]MCX4909676.1 nucleotidyltransferase domain-containing protein [Streptomyces sp. NBC_00878]